MQEFKYLEEYVKVPSLATEREMMAAMTRWESQRKEKYESMTFKILGTYENFIFPYKVYVPINEYKLKEVLYKNPWKVEEEEE